MTDAIWLALIVAIPPTVASVVVAPLTIWLTNIGNRKVKEAEAAIRHQERVEDNARQDLIAQRAADTAEQAAAKAAEAASLLLAANERVANTAKVTNNKLDVIHTLVNSNMTAAMQAEYDATVRELAMMREVIALKKVAGHQPSAEAVNALTATETKIAEMRASLDDRLKQAKVVDRQTEEQTLKEKNELQRRMEKDK